MSAARIATKGHDRSGAGSNAGEPAEQRRIQLLYGIFVLSGFSGLIYESIWTHYLKLFLGHAAYAQALVLAIFMGGMALGSGLCSRYSAAWKNVLMGYALVEGIAGLIALGFHPLFEAAIRFSFETVLPALESKAGASLYTWTLSALLILPQSVLLGMTFPLMSAGILRLKPRDPGRTIATLYFTNSLGASLGVLTSGFILIRALGLPGTVMLAGVLNIVLAVAVWHLIGKAPATGHTHEGTADEMAGNGSGRREKASTQRTGLASIQRLLLVSAAVTGAASFIYEIGWIRMLSLVLGTSTTAFELMLSAFILGLALGGLWIRRRIDGIERSGRYLAFIQMIMGACALLSLVLYGYSFDVMQWLNAALEKTDRGYFLFNLSSSAIAMAIMLPATFCAGMTLPLITRSLIAQGSGERSIGSVYAANTVGAIIGVVFAIHIGFPVFGLQKLVTVGAVLDIGLGLVLLWYYTKDASRRPLIIAAGMALVLVIATLRLVQFDTYKMASGIYRQNVLLTPENSSILYHRDGKTATVSVTQLRGGKVSIRTNGKVDAAVNMTPGDLDRGDADEDTMILAGILPMTLNPEARTAAIIGFGSGLTTQTLLSNPRIRRVDTIEIEEKMVEAANAFRPRVELAYSDPRSSVIINDAKAFFTINNSSYDIIVSEPSNPWVSGVASLFSVEFYRTVSRHLSDSGLFVQWVQLYEIDTELIVSVLKAMDAVFEDYTVYAANDGDSIIVARKRGRLAGPDPHMLTMPELSYSLQRSHIYGIQDIELRTMGTKRFFKPLLRSYSLPANSDYDPVLDQRAVRARFLGKNALELHQLSRGVFPALDMLDPQGAGPEVTSITPYARYARSQSAWIAMVLRDYLLHNRLETRYGKLPVPVKENADRVKQMLSGRSSALGEEERLGSLFNTMMAMLPYLSPREMDVLWNRLLAGTYARVMSERERDMVSLLRAVGGRNGPEIVRASERILGNKHVNPGVVKYTTAAGMLGALMSGDKERALRIWTPYGPRLFGEGQPDLLFRLLYSETTSGQ